MKLQRVLATETTTTTTPTSLDGVVHQPDRSWRVAQAYGLVAYVLSRSMVLAAGAIVAASTKPKPTSAVRPLIDMLTSWDGLWYLSIVRNGYPTSVPPNLTYFQPEARAAFFPLYPMLVRAVDLVLPGGDSMAALVLNAMLGVAFILLVGALAREVFSVRVARRAMVLTALFPGAFVLSFAYAEALMLVLACACLLALVRRQWLLAGIVAAVATASRPNALALVAACAVTAFIAIRQRREWSALVAPALSPIGFIAFQVYLWQRTGEAFVWFRVQQEAWNEGASFGFTALRDIALFTVHPFESAVNAVTALCVAATLFGFWVLLRVKLPAPLVAYSVVVVGLMLLPATVTARPRFLLTAFPLLIATAAFWPEEHDEAWGLVLATCAAGLVTVTGLYGVFAAIP